MANVIQTQTKLFDISDNNMFWIFIQIFVNTLNYPRKARGKILKVATEARVQQGWILNRNKEVIDIGLSQVLTAQATLLKGKKTTVICNYFGFSVV